MKKLPGDVYPNQPPGKVEIQWGLGVFKVGMTSLALFRVILGCLMRMKTLKRPRTLRTRWKNSKGVLRSDTKIAHI